jgi:polyphenol oxidase
LAAKRAAYRSALFLNLSQYAISAGVKSRRAKRSPCRSKTPWMREVSTISTPVPTIMPRYLKTGPSRGVNVPPRATSPSRPLSALCCTIANRGVVCKFTPTPLTLAYGMCYVGNLVRENFQLVARGGLQWTESNSLSGIPQIVHAFSLRRGGICRVPAAGLNLGFTPQAKRTEVEENRGRFLSQLGAEQFSLASLRQTHSSTVYLASHGASGNLEYRLAGSSVPQPTNARLPEGDALLTDQPGILLSVRTADCLPVLLVDRRRRAVAAVHAGWRGALARVAEKAVGEMRRLFGSRPEDLLAALGPSIRACCYEVGQEVVDAFDGRFANSEKFFRRDPAASGHARAAAASLSSLSIYPPGHAPAAAPVARLDLVAVAEEQLLCAGLRAANIQPLPFCTACRTDLFFSHRKEGSLTGRMMAVIGIRP